MTYSLPLLMFENNARKRRGEREGECCCRSLRDVMITCNEAGTVARRSQLLKRLGAGAHARVATPPSPTLRAPLWYKPATTVPNRSLRRTKRSPVFSFMFYDTSTWFSSDRARPPAFLMGGGTWRGARTGNSRAVPHVYTVRSLAV